MSFDLTPFSNVPITEARLRELLGRHTRDTTPRLTRFWRYYRNPILHERDPITGVVRPRLAQESGLPPRLTSARAGDDRDPADREIVIENDIAWRLHAMIDFMIGGPVTLLSGAADERTRQDIQRILDAVIESSGGVALLQDAALLSSIYGYVDFALRTDELFAAPPPPDGFNSAAAAIDLASRIRIEIVEPPRAVPVISRHDYRRLDAYIIHFTGAEAPADVSNRARFLAALRSRLHGADDDTSTTEIFSPSHHQLYDRGRLVLDAPNPLGVLPVVHIQNTSQPFQYEGLSEVEPLIPLQDELNTRLSDRAHRVTLQSFKLYLAKGLDDDAPVRAVAPGQVWTTSNPDASIESFGADAASPSEDNHIQQLREAMDKTSAVNPIAAGVLRARVGQLSSENALRITLLGTLAKTARKQLAFGKGLAQLAELILLALDRAGVYRTAPEDRAVTVQWPDPLPRQEREELEAARLKLELGVPRERVLAELGYAPNVAALS